MTDTRMPDISDATIRALAAKAFNPTGTDHTVLPWQKGNAYISAPGHVIANAGGIVLATFEREADRDLALYFTNTHAGVIALIRNMADAFEFIAKGTGDDGTAAFAREEAERGRIYADLFCRMGRAPDQEPPAAPEAAPLRGQRVDSANMGEDEP